MNSWIEAIILGIVQGLTEFLPISSSAHLRVASELMGGEDAGAAFTAITQIGTEAAVLLYFRKDIWRIATAWLTALFGNKAAMSEEQRDDARMGWLVIIGTLPIAILGLLLEDLIDYELRNLWITGSMLIGFALVLAVADRRGAKRKELSQLSWKDGIILGFAQAMALVPGVSRSGGTISVGLMLGYKREAAARYSFLLAIPAVLASGFYKLAVSYDEPGYFTLAETAVATLVSFVVGYAVIVAFLAYISSRSFMPFVIYRCIAGLGIFALLAAGVIEAL